VTTCAPSEPSSCSCTGSGERAGAGAGNSGATSGRDVSRMPVPVRCEGPMTSLTIRPRSTLCEGDVRGSMSCEGGGQTLSWNIEPDSDARARRRRGGDGDDEVESAAGTYACDDCERE